MPTPDLVIGVDGGGTKTSAWLARLSPSCHGPLGRGQAGPGNPRAVGFETAPRNIGLAIDEAFAAAGIPPVTLARACLALAGADRPAERAQLEAWGSQRHLAEQLIVTNDAEPILAAGAENGWGVALICGTGSFAFARNAAGQTARCGGWGYLLGDEG